MIKISKISLIFLTVLSCLSFLPSHAMKRARPDQQDEKCRILQLAEELSLEERFQLLLSLQRGLNNEKRNELIEDAEALNMWKLQQLFYTVPDDLWTEIFSIVAPIYAEPKLHDNQLDKLVSLRLVCKAWNKVVLKTSKISIPEHLPTRRVLELFRNVDDLTISQNISIDLATIIPNLPKLAFYPGTAPIKTTQNGLKNLSLLTNLTDLNLKNNPFIKDPDICGLTNLTALDLTSNAMICGKTLQNLPLQTLNLSSNFKVSNHDVCKITTLKNLIRIGPCSVTPALFNNPNSTNLEHITTDSAEFLSAFGHGKLIYWDGSYYVGPISNNKRSNKGVFHGADGASYEGEWLEDRYDGDGHLIDPKGEYKGQWSQGKKHGKGTMKYLNQNRNSIDAEVEYKGHWSQDRKHGEGTMIYANGAVYVGHWEEDKRHGFGTLKKDDHGYEGHWKNGLFHGYGRLVNALGEYNGDWFEAMKHGDGVMTYADGQEYDGKWKRNQRVGFGVLTKDDHRFAGYWQNDLRHGEGTVSSSNGHSFDGLWHKGTMLIDKAEMPPEDNKALTPASIESDDKLTVTELLDKYKDNMGELLQLSSAKHKKQQRDFGLKTAISLHCMASVNRDEKNYSEALSLQAEAFKAMNKFYGRNHELTLSMIHFSAELFELKNDISKNDISSAEKLHKNALECRQKKISIEGYDTSFYLDSLKKLGLHYRKTQNFAAALEVEFKALDQVTAIFGPEHELVATIKHIIAESFELSDDLKSSGQFHQEALKLREKNFIQKNSDVSLYLDSLRKMALYHRKLLSFARAKDFSLKAYEVAKKAFGEEHPEALKSNADIAGHALALKNFSVAKIYFTMSLEAKKKALGLEHNDTLQTLDDLHEVCLKLNEAEEAKAHKEVADEIRLKLKQQNLAEAIKLKEMVEIITDESPYVLKCFRAEAMNPKI